METTILLELYRVYPGVMKGSWKRTRKLRHYRGYIGVYTGVFWKRKRKLLHNWRYIGVIYRGPVHSSHLNPSASMFLVS